MIRPCVQFGKTKYGNVIANVTIYQNRTYLDFDLLDQDYQSLIESIEAIWPDWFDYNQYMAKLQLRENQTVTYYEYRT